MHRMMLHRDAIPLPQTTDASRHTLRQSTQATNLNFVVVIRVHCHDPLAPLEAQLPVVWSLAIRQNRSYIFQVTLGRTKSIADLKEGIREKKKPAFDHVPADTLVLWKVSVRVDSNLKRKC